MSNKVCKHGNVPFSWENKPGVSKVKQQDTRTVDLHHRALQPPPPLPPLTEENSRASLHQDMKIPLPPCASQPPLRSNSSKRGVKKIDDDPFLVALKECTKSIDDDRRPTSRAGREDQGFGLKKNMAVLSCKKSCSVVENSIVKPSKVLVSRSMRSDSQRKGIQS